MKHEKEFNEFFKMCVWILECNLQDFNMRRGARTHLSVRRILDGIGIRTHESNRSGFNRIRKSLLKIHHDILFCAPVTTVGVWIMECGNVKMDIDRKQVSELGVWKLEQPL